MSPVDRYMAEQRLNSTYELHDDGSGTFYSSWRRPVSTSVPTTACRWCKGRTNFLQTSSYFGGSTPKKSPTKCIADDDLHRHGHAALANFRAIVTGSHPEYWSPPMLAGLDDYLEAGGRLVYLGGNGFYWVTICP